MTEIDSTTMPEPLKNLYTTELVTAVATAVRACYSRFDEIAFIEDVFADPWVELELKQRMTRLTESLHRHLSLPYAEALEVLCQAACRFTGFEYMFFPEFVERYGLDDFDRSVDALGRMTPYASSEFAVRPFIKRYPEAMMTQMQAWAGSDDEHQRRLASEGCRPRLPWAMALPDFQRDPAAVLPVLETLKNDDSEYVRRSVANNLNDISKDHPQLVVDIAGHWFGNNENTDRLVRHACRTLLKQGQPDVMLLFGYAPPDRLSIKNLKLTKTVEANGEQVFSFDLVSASGSIGQVRLDFGIGFLRKNGSLSHKVFKLSESTIAETGKSFRKSFSFRPITTRVYYPGQHELVILVNGVELARGDFQLLC